MKREVYFSRPSSRGENPNRINMNPDAPFFQWEAVIKFPSGKTRIVTVSADRAWSAWMMAETLLEADDIPADSRITRLTKMREDI